VIVPDNPELCSADNQSGLATISIRKKVNIFRRLYGIECAKQGSMATILLVDDDPLQASLMMSLLGSRFGNVCRVSDAAEALCLIEQPEFAGKLDLVITGHHILGIGGPAFVAELRSRKPGLPVLVLAAKDAAPSEYSGAHVVFLPRPFGGDKMLAVTGQMLSDQTKAVA
jgi:DNA-binding NtrC family response regulator